MRSTCASCCSPPSPTHPWSMNTKPWKFKLNFAFDDDFQNTFGMRFSMIIMSSLTLFSRDHLQHIRCHFSDKSVAFLTIYNHLLVFIKMFSEISIKFLWELVEFDLSCNSWEAHKGSFQLRPILWNYFYFFLSAKFHLKCFSYLLAASYFFVIFHLFFRDFRRACAIQSIFSFTLCNNILECRLSQTRGSCRGLSPGSSQSWPLPQTHLHTFAPGIESWKWKWLICYLYTLINTL